MKTKLHLIIMSLVLLFVAGGQSVCLAADTWSYPTTKPETPFGGGDGSRTIHSESRPPSILPTSPI